MTQIPQGGHLAAFRYTQDYGMWRNAYENMPPPPLSTLTAGANLLEICSRETRYRLALDGGRIRRHQQR